MQRPLPWAAGWEVQTLPLCYSATSIKLDWANALKPPIQGCMLPYFLWVHLSDKVGVGVMLPRRLLVLKRIPAASGASMRPPIQVDHCGAQFPWPLQGYPPQSYAQECPRKTLPVSHGESKLLRLVLPTRPSALLCYFAIFPLDKPVLRSIVIAPAMSL